MTTLVSFDDRKWSQIKSTLRVPPVDVLRLEACIRVGHAVAHDAKSSGGPLSGLRLAILRSASVGVNVFDVLPLVFRAALSLRRLFPAGRLPSLSDSDEGHVVLSREQCGCLNAMAFMGIGPDTSSFFDLHRATRGPAQNAAVTRIESMLAYFRATFTASSEQEGIVVVQRLPVRSLPAEPESGGTIPKAVQVVCGPVENSLGASVHVVEATDALDVALALRGELFAATTAIAVHPTGQDIVVVDGARRTLAGYTGQGAARRATTAWAPAPLERDPPTLVLLAPPPATEAGGGRLSFDALVARYVKRTLLLGCATATPATTAPPDVLPLLRPTRTATTT